MSTTTTCGSPGRGGGGAPAGGGQFLPAPRSYINKPGWRKRRRQRRSWKRTWSSQPPRILSFSTRPFLGNFGPAEIAPSPLGSPQRGQARDSGGIVTGCSWVYPGFLHGACQPGQPGAAAGGGGERWLSRSR
uniref:Uncharacterized protein n=1 Tax=Myotis myotis TaxID=51298 RepID=A0A7J7XHF1_MYOMY|nr:hypothetical protein mMyoMyo1_011703 [Myotis myotis]